MGIPRSPRVPAMIAADAPVRQVSRSRRLMQQGSYLLEALIAILIVAIGVLGVVGLYVRSIQNVDDAKFRGEAALLVNTLVGQMWTSDTSFASLQAKFDSGIGGAGYTEFAAMVAQRMPNSVPPTVVVAAGSTLTSTDVLITVQWIHPGDNDPLLPAPLKYRQYQVNATIGSN
jgi:type IV pilus assembly protein PilV